MQQEGVACRMEDMWEYVDLERCALICQFREVQLSCDMARKG